MLEHTIVIDENLSTNFEFILDDVLFSSTCNLLQKKTFFIDIHSKKIMRKVVNINNSKISQKISQKISKKISQKIFVIFKRSLNLHFEIFNNAFKTFNKSELYIMLKTSTNIQVNHLNNNEFDMHYIQSSDDDNI